VPVPEAVLSPLARRALDWYLMSDLPSKDSQVRVDGDRIILDWQPTNLRAHAMLVQRMKEVFRAAGYPLILTKPFGNKAPSHQCGTIRMGTDPANLSTLCAAAMTTRTCWSSTRRSFRHLPR
jgi:hypothetical protein